MRTRARGGNQARREWGNQDKKVPVLTLRMEETLDRNWRWGKIVSYFLIPSMQNLLFFCKGYFFI